LIAYLNENQNRFTRVDAHGPDGHENLVFTVLQREKLESLLTKLKEIIPSAFYTVEKVNRAAESGTVVQESTRWSIAGWLRGIKKD
jgi:hypothetical protein